MTRPITRRTVCVKLPDLCVYCGGDVYIGMEGFAGAACASCQKPEAPRVNIGECPSCGVIVAEGVAH